MEKKKILLVDDEESLLRLLKRVLEQKGYEVAVEQNATQASQKAREFKPQIIFIDITMPEMEGSAVASEIRSDSTLKQVPIIFLTGAVSSEEVESSGGKIGGEFFLAKPIDANKLVHCIEEHLTSE